MSSEADGFASGNRPALPDSAFWPAATSPADLGLVGSPDMSTRELRRVLCGPGLGSGQCATTTLVPVTPDIRPLDRDACRPSVLDRRVERNRPRLGDFRCIGIDRLERAVVFEELVEHALNCGFDVIGTAVAHVGVLVAGLHNRNAGLLADVLIGDDT